MIYSDLVNTNDLFSIKLRYSLENNGKIIFSKLINFSEKNNSHILKTFIKATKEGTNFFTSKIEYLENEKNIVNNSKNFSVEVIDKQSEILIISSFYHPDLGALKKAIESDKQRKVTIKIVDNKNISPMDGVGPKDLTIESLMQKVKNEEFSELIFALSATMEADTTNFYIYKLLSRYSVKTSTIARGIPVGDELEYTDEVTLGRSILARIPFEASISKS